MKRSVFHPLTGLALVAASLAVAACGKTAQPLPGALSQAARSESLSAFANSSGANRQVLVKLRAGVDGKAFAAKRGLRYAGSIGLNIHRLEGASARPQLSRDAEVLWSEAERAIEAPRLEEAPASRAPKAPRSADGPNDPLLAAQYGWHLVGGAQAHAQAAKGKGVVVAIIDSGIDASHPEFAGQLLPGWDVSGKEAGPGGNEDGYGHGTHVAGVVGALANNGQGIAGLAPEAKLLPVRIFNNFGHSKEGASAAAVIWAVDHGAQVINASWGSPLPGEASKEAVRYAMSKNVVFVAAVGNSGKNGDEDPSYPAAIPGVLAVAGTTDTDGWASFSTFGNFITLAAPGESILSTYPMAKGNGYRIMRGTSMAAPCVSACAAVLRGAYPQMSQEQIRERFYGTAKDVIQNGFDPYSGHGRIDLAKALAAASSP